MADPLLVLLHSPLTGPRAWGWLPAELRAAGRETVAVEVTEDDRPPYAQRYVASAALQIARAAGPQPVVLVAHSWAGPLLPQIGFARRSARAPVAGYVFCDASLPRPGTPTRLELLEFEDPALAAELRAVLEAGGRFPAWTDADLRPLVPDDHDRAALLRSVRPRPLDFFTEPLPSAPDWPDAPCAYLRTSEAFDRPARIAASRGWPVASRDGGHFAALVDPQGLARDLLALLDRL